MSRTKRICIISTGHLSTNPRLVKEAVALKAAGFEIQVVHGHYNTWGSANDARIGAEIGAVTAVPFGPTEAPRLTYLKQSLFRKAALAIAKCGFHPNIVSEFALSPVGPELKFVASGIKADLYIAHYVAALPAAALAARRYAAAYAFDAEDFHLGDLPDRPEHALEKRIIRSIEGRYLPGAAYVTAASPLIADAYAETYGIPRPKVVLNVFPKSHGPAAPTAAGAASPGPSLYWFSQTIGSGRGIETAVEAIARANSRPHLYLRGIPARGYAETLRSLATRAGVSDRVHLLDPAPPDELERLGANYDIGFSGETGFSTNNNLALGNKLFSYLMSGLAILASDIPSHRQIAPQLGHAMRLFAVGDPDALAAAIDKTLLDPARLGAARQHSWKRAQERFCWDVEATTLINHVQSVLNTKAQLV